RLDREDFRAIELGDTILMIAAGAYLGTQAVIVAAFIGIVSAGFIGFIYKKVKGESKFAFGPFLSIGIAVAALWGNEIAQWYLALPNPQ
ncbi:MAG TPA: A24 family peptidase, partial [Ruminococcus sp.]|nr:A24 family peptidase [Ruminococcus sp.]